MSRLRLADRFVVESASAYSTAQVVLPTPPLPAKKTNWGLGPGD
jgi:hypothetical protein